MSMFPTAEFELKEIMSDIEISKYQPKCDNFYTLKHHLNINGMVDYEVKFLKTQVEKELSLLEKISNNMVIDFGGKTAEEFFQTLSGKKLYVLDPDEMKAMKDKAEKYDKLCEMVNAIFDNK